MCSVTLHPLLTETDFDVWQSGALATVSNQEQICLFSDNKARASSSAQTMRMMAEVLLLQSRKIQGRAAMFLLSSRVSVPPSFCTGNTHGQVPWHQVQQWGSSSPGNVSACCFLLLCCLRCWKGPQFLELSSDVHAVAHSSRNVSPSLFRSFISAIAFSLRIQAFLARP